MRIRSHMFRDKLFRDELIKNSRRADKDIARIRRAISRQTSRFERLFRRRWVT